MKKKFTNITDELYALDTCVLEADLSRIRKGVKIKNGFYDAEFVYSVTKGSTVGFIVCVLYDLSNSSIVKAEMYSKRASMNNAPIKQLLKNAWRHKHMVYTYPLLKIAMISPFIGIMLPSVLE